MGGCNWNDSIRLDPAAYKDQPYSQRTERRLTVGRSRGNSKAHLAMNLFAVMEGGVPPTSLFWPIGECRRRRRGGWSAYFSLSYSVFHT